jgi:hypothetical protein
VEPISTALMVINSAQLVLGETAARRNTTRRLALLTVLLLQALKG